MKIARVFAAGAALAPLLMAGLAGPVNANGVGDLYVASPAGVLEIHVSTSTVVSVIDMLQPPQALGFAPDGKTLYVGNGGARLTPIDIATLNLEPDIATPGPVTALAFPAGQILVGTMPVRRTLAFVTVHGNAVTESAELPGPGNLIAADRRDPRVAVAEAGESWLEVVDPSTTSARRSTLEGKIQALAIDRGNAAVFVATSEPNALVRVDLTTLQNSWTLNLPGAPTAVVATSQGAIVAGGTDLWSVSATAATAWGTARGTVVAMSASDEGNFIHVAEPGAVEVFDLAGQLQRTLELGPGREPVAMAAVPAGSSLYMGHGAGATGSPKPSAAAGTPGAFQTQKPPPTGTVLDTANDVISYPPVQGALAVALTILLGYWLIVRWYEKRVRA